MLRAIHSAVHPGVEFHPSVKLVEGVKEKPRSKECAHSLKGIFSSFHCDTCYHLFHKEDEAVAPFSYLSYVAASLTEPLNTLQRHRNTPVPNLYEQDVPLKTANVRYREHPLI